MEESLLDLALHLVLTALLAGALCVASIVAAGGLALAVWAIGRVGHGIGVLVRWARAAYAQRVPRTHSIAVPAFRHRLRRP